MKPNIDLSKINIEELEEVTEGYWKDGEWMIVNNIHNLLKLKKVVVVNKNISEYSVITIDSCFYHHAYKLPENAPKKMPTRLEAMAYLHRLQGSLHDGEMVLVVPKMSTWRFYQYWTYNERLENYTIAIFDKYGKMIEGSEHGFDCMREV